MFQLLNLTIGIISIIINIQFGFLSSTQITQDSKTTNNHMRISEQKCEEYKEVYRQVFVSPLPYQFNDTVHGDVTCPMLREALIIGGADALPYEFPAMVSLLYPTVNESDQLVPKCGGVLISEQFVLTAAHCLILETPTKIVLGETNIAPSANKLTPRRLESNVSRIILHEDYQPPGSKHDIALLKLPQPLSLKSGPRITIRPACLQQTEVPTKMIVDAVGFGTTESFGVISARLQAVQLPVVPREECSDFYRDTLDFEYRFPGVSEKQRETWNIPNTIICAGGIEGRSACQGDSGGPLFISPNTKYSCHRYVIGITSFGSHFCGSLTPTLYTKISSYIDWIETHVWPSN